jgi:hypothetical protein
LVPPEFRERLVPLEQLELPEKLDLQALLVLLAQLALREMMDQLAPQGIKAKQEKLVILDLQDQQGQQVQTD